MTVAVAIVLEEEVIVVEEVVRYNPICITNHIRQLKGIENGLCCRIFWRVFQKSFNLTFTNILSILVLCSMQFGSVAKLSIFRVHLGQFKFRTATQCAPHAPYFLKEAEQEWPQYDPREAQVRRPERILW